MLKFVPEDPEHIDFITLQHKNNPELDKDVKLSNIMPFEWFKNKAGDSVLLLWINDDVFQKEPLSRLAALSACIGFSDKNKLKNEKELRFKIIGPAGSTTLLEMIWEMKEANPEKRFSLLAALSGMEIYSATATVDGSLFATGGREKEGPIPPAPKDFFEKEFRDFSQEIIFNRTTASDRELAQKLVDELHLRNLDLLLQKEKGDNHNHKKDKDPYGGHRDHVVLVAEWDTFYGRLLPETFVRVLKEKHNENVSREDIQYIKEEKDITWVHRFSYLRGLDGRLPGELEGGKGEKQEKENSTQEDIKKLEQPTGKSQYDYLRRLAQSIYNFDQDLQAKEQGAIKAIGVLGTDFYDKYLVLQALRQRFPGIIFFTTDLDARLLNPEYIKWTRNLVVASNFGLSLHQDETKNIQEDVTPFRDNYQTSIFLATLWAFGKEKDSVLKEEKIRPEPRIFEVGRQTAVDLKSLSASSPSDGEAYPISHKAGTIAKTSGKIAIIAILLLIFLCFTSNRISDEVKSIWLAGKKHPYIAMILLFLLIFVVVLFFVQVLGNPNEEPFSLFEGVSIWPTELIRIIGVLLSLHFWRTARRRLRENCEKIGQEFHFRGCPGCEDSAEAGEKAGDRRAGSEGGIWRKTIGRMTYNWEVGSPNEGLTVDKHWTEYVLRDTWPYLLARLIAITGLYLGLGFCVIHFFGRPMRPLRGVTSFYFDIGIMALSVISFISLTSYIFDATRLFHRFIRGVSESAPTWSEGALKQFKAVPGEAGKPMGEWMLVHLIASRSDAVGRLIFYPFIIWFILFISRINYFDNWQTPIGLAVVISMGAVYAWSAVFVLRRSAEKARTDAICRLASQLVGALAEEKPDQDKVKRIEFVLQEVKSIREGAFAPFSQHPAVQALFVPFGGVGGLYLIEEFLGKLNI
jgi:hypothetical protein